jgi:hypothetical protein
LLHPSATATETISGERQPMRRRRRRRRRQEEEEKERKRVMWRRVYSKPKGHKMMCVELRARRKTWATTRACASRPSSRTGHMTSMS